MKKSLPAFVCLLQFAITANAQFYFRGEIKETSNQPVPFARIQIKSTNNFYYTGSTGAFGIPSSVKEDSVIISLNGYESITILLASENFNQVVLKPTGTSSTLQKKKRLSFTKDKLNSDKTKWSVSGESYTELIENDFNTTAQFPVTGFALNVDKASYSNIRRFITMNSEVPVDAVRIEEMLNYFPVPYKEPEPGKIVAQESILTDCPWNKNNKLWMLRMHTRKIAYDSAPPANLVLLIDISGSMDLPNRLPLLKTAFRLMVQNLRPVDTIAVVTYGGNVVVALQPTAGNEQDKILKVIDSLEAGGETPGGSALRTAYNLIQSRVLRGGNNRIILATDGDFNVGEITEEALMQLVTQKQQSGVYLTCIGVGMGNYKDSKLEALAKKGNGNFAYFDKISEAEKILITECMQTFYISAADAFMNLRFNAEFVKQYRLIGYDNRKDVLTDTSINMDGGEMGSGHAVTAVFEIEPAADITSMNAPVATAEFSYLPYGAVENSNELFPFYASYFPFATVDSSYRFAMCIVLFGQLLRHSEYVSKERWQTLVDMLPSSVDAAQYLQKEFQTLVIKAKEIYNPLKKKRSWFIRKE